jgi:hypothetical protein
MDGWLGGWTNGWKEVREGGRETGTWEECEEELWEDRDIWRSLAIRQLT